jgi:hypothetical protein
MEPELWAYIAELVNQHIIPDGIRDILATVLAQQLLKKDKNDRYTKHSATRPIGKCERPLADFLRGDATRVSACMGRLLTLFGQYAVAVRSGGEAVSSAIQIR